MADVVATVSRRIGAKDHEATALLLFTHAAGFVKEMWQPILDQLERLLPASQAFDCLLLDHTGHGDSRHRLHGAPRPLAWPSFCREDLAEALATSTPGRRVGRRIGVGHSMGAAGLVYSELDRPGTFDAMVLLEPILPPPGALTQGGNLPEVALRRRSSWPNRQEAHSTLRSRGIYAAFDSRVFERFIQHGLVDDGPLCRLKCEPWVESEIYKVFGETVWPRLAEIRCPVWILAGGSSHHLDALGHGRTPEIYRRMAGCLHLGVFRSLEGLGHFANFEAPGHFAEVLCEALGTFDDNAWRPAPFARARL